MHGLTLPIHHDLTPINHDAKLTTIHHDLTTVHHDMSPRARDRCHKREQWFSPPSHTASQVTAQYIRQSPYLNYRCGLKNVPYTSKKKAGTGLSPRHWQVAVWQYMALWWCQTAGQQARGNRHGATGTGQQARNKSMLIRIRIRIRNTNHIH